MTMEDILKKIEPYNLWNGNALHTGYFRKEYTDRLSRYTGNRLVKIITGQRRSGKSYIMRQLAMHMIETGVCAHNILLINRELSVYDFLQTSRDLDVLIDAYRKHIAKEGKIHIFIDEVQDISGWEKVKERDFLSPWTMIPGLCATVSGISWHGILKNLCK